MKGNHGDDDPAETALGEHRECMQVVAGLEAALGERADRDGGWVERVVPHVQALIETMREHFAEEVAASLYREVPQRVPRFGPQLERLEAEHATMLRDATEIARRAGTIDRAHTDKLRELHASVRLLIATIRRHEAEENEILLTAHWREIGGGD